MSVTEQIITIAAVVLGTMLTRFLPFLLFPAGKPTPRYVQYLGKALPGAVFVPALTLWGGTVLRRKLDLPRPYDQPGFTPLVAKETRGRSFPSRHALSAAVLVAVWLYFYPFVGRIMTAVALGIGALRVMAGVHFVRDVAAGFALGFALGAAGMWL